MNSADGFANFTCAGVFSSIKLQPLVAEQQQQMSTYKTPTPDILIHTDND